VIFEKFIVYSEYNGLVCSAKELHSFLNCLSPLRVYLINVFKSAAAEKLSIGTRPFTGWRTWPIQVALNVYSSPKHSLKEL